MKRILGLDLGTNSIGWAVVNEATAEGEKSQIIKAGVRVIPLTVDEQINFEKGASFSVNQARTDKRSARRGLQRYKLRRKKLIKTLIDHKILAEDTVLAEHGKNSTYQLWELRAKAAEQQIPLEDFARVLLAINKKRGYKSNRKAKGQDEGQIIDGMEIAKILYEKNLTPGEYVASYLSESNKYVPDFYPSDLNHEFDKIWNFQQRFYPNQLTETLKEELKGKNKTQTWAILKSPLNLVGIPIKDTQGKVLKGFNFKLAEYNLRKLALTEQIEPESLAIVLQNINAQLKSTSGYLGDMSDRSKSLYFNNQTIGQQNYKLLQHNRHTKLKGKAFYRQDYLDEFDKIWSTQSQYYPEILTQDLKTQIGEITIFHQRPLRSQKGLISVCSLEGKLQELTSKRTQNPYKKLIGPKVIAKSNPLFQQFKYWQILNNLEIRNKQTREVLKINELDDDELTLRNILASELDIKGKLTAAQVLKVLVLKDSKKWELNYKEGIEGNRYNGALYEAYGKIIELTDQVVDFKKPAISIKEQLTQAFINLGINSEILTFDAYLEGQNIEQQPAWQLWHLLYSYEGDNSSSGNDALYQQLKAKFGIKREYAEILATVHLEDDYGSISARAIRKILPHLKAGDNYADACAKAGYNHSNFLTKEANKARELKDELELLPKNSLRNPVVEKILNQMINVVNQITETYGKPDEIRIELARELKKSAAERESLTKVINEATKKHDKIREKIAKLPQFTGGVRITRNDIIRYKLWEELITNGNKTLYSDTYIAEEELFSKRFDIEHIIPKALVFDDSFSNKTLELRNVNQEKSSQTAYDFVSEKSMSELKDIDSYEQTIISLYNKGVITKAKHDKLLKPAHKLEDGFIERDLRNTQYIAKKAQEILTEIVRDVIPTTGTVTDRLRDDWQLINVLKELNWNTYDQLGLTHEELTKEGQKIKQITDWTKRNDQRHHAMDAITIAFTKRAYIQYFNHLNARRGEFSKSNKQAKIYILNGKNLDAQQLHQHIFAIEQKYTYINDNGKRSIKPPMPIADLRHAFKTELESILVSYKAKNKVVTKNTNITKKKQGKNKQKTLTPRGQLHKETVYAKGKHYITKDEKIGVKFDTDKIALVANQRERQALSLRLQEYDNNPKLAFTGKNAPSKNPIYLDDAKTQLLADKVKLAWLETRYTIRKSIDKDLKIDKVIDKRIQSILQQRLEDNDSKADKAFANLEDNPIWLNEAQGIQIKKVTISGVSNAEPLHFKHDHHGELIVDSYGDPIPVDYVQTGNNHHVAIYVDEQGSWQERVVSHYHSVQRAADNKLAVDTNYKQAQGWSFLFSMKQNEMFVFANEQTGFNPHEIDLLDQANYAVISPNLYRVQKIAASGQYDFRHHLETVVQRKTKEGANVNEKPLRDIIWKRFQSLTSLEESLPVKLRTNHLGQIVHVGEY